MRTSLSARQSTASGARRKVWWAAQLRSHLPMGLLARAGAALAPGRAALSAWAAAALYHLLRMHIALQ